MAQSLTRCENAAENKKAGTALVRHPAEHIIFSVTGTGLLRKSVPVEPAR